MLNPYFALLSLRKSNVNLSTPHRITHTASDELFTDPLLLTLLLPLLLTLLLPLPLCLSYADEEMPRDTDHPTFDRERRRAPPGSLQLEQRVKEPYP